LLKKSVRKIKWNDTKDITFKSNLLHFDFEKLCEDLENITKPHENQRSDPLLNETIINEKVSEFSSFFD
jgi:hypothetical protein